MDKLELREGMGVYTPHDEQVGTISGFILDPGTNEITHLVVQKGWLFSVDRVVPFNRVSSADDEKVRLKESIDDINELAPFEESHYIRSIEADVSRGGHPRYGGTGMSEEGNREPINEADVSRGGQPKYGPMLAPAYYWYPPYGYAGLPVGYYGWPRIETTRNIPEGTIPLREGTDVISSDGEHVGDVERLFVEPDTNRATHLTISQGLLFKDRKLVPAHWVRSVEEDTIHLSVSSEVLEGLPSYEE